MDIGVALKNVYGYQRALHHHQIFFLGEATGGKGKGKGTGAAAPIWRRPWLVHTRIMNQTVYHYLIQTL